MVAIGTDYIILLAERLREELHDGHSPQEAAEIAIANDRPTVAASGTIHALTFASLILTGLDNLKKLGAGAANKTKPAGPDANAETPGPGPDGSSYPDDSSLVKS